MELNNVAKTYLFFRNSGLPVKFVEDVKMQIHGDMSRFDEARRLSLRISSRGDQQLSTDLYASSSIGSMVDNTAYEDYYQDSWDSWTWDGWRASDVYYDQCVDDHWADSAWSYDAWMREGEEEELWHDAQDTASEWHSPEHYDMAAGDEAADAPAAEEYYQGTNDGCFVCGSKYHRAAQCPVNHGHSGSPGKGFQGKGKGKKGKSKGFGKNRKGFKGKSKGKGKGKGKPYYYDDYYAYRRQPDHGLFATGSPTRSSSSTTTSKTIVQESPPRQVGELFAWRGSAPAEEESVTTPSTPPADPAKRSLNFATTLHTSADVFHTVQGHKRRGLLIDPGAAAGLVGSETLRDIIEHCYPNAHREEAITWSDSDATITGISGQPDKALGRVHLQLPLKDMKATYTADVIGNAGSLCPALVGNPALCEMRASLHSRWFDNNDGLLVTWDTNNSVKPEMHLFRCLLTGSGHYLLPLDEQAEVPSQHYEACHFIRHLSNVSKTKWPDHAYTFWQSVTQTEADPKQKWRSDEPPEIKDTNSPKQVSFADSELTDSKEADDTFPEAEITEAVEKALDSTSEEAISTAITSSSPIEESMTKAMTPSSTSEEPVSTAIDEVFGTGFDKLPLYARDDFPPHLSSSDLTRLHKDYKAMPEEYYTRSGKRVVTPQNFNTWLGEARRKKVKWHGWELCSGSGRFSLLCIFAGLTMGFPVDYRYGWDIAHPDHQKMLDQAYETCCPDFLLCSPRCKFWSISSSRRDRQELMKDRESERPALVYLQDKMYQQTIRQKIYLLEHPWSSALWTESVMTENKTFVGHRRAKRTDQCAFGACAENRQPILKATGLEANFKLRASLKRCNGHRGVPHLPLQGQHRGISRTAMAAVYPVRFCRAIIEDILYHLQPRGSFRPNRLNALTNVEIFYKCERCSMGRAALPFMEHSFIPGECRYGRHPDKAPATPSMAANPLEDFKRAAKSHALAKKVELNYPEDFDFTAEEAVWIKYLMCEIRKSSLAVFDEAKGEDYIYWLTDPSLLMAVKHCLKKITHVHGVHVTLHPFVKAFPEPHLSAENAPLRLICRGTYESWQLYALEDLRELSPAQQREAIDEEDWMITFFGNNVPPSTKVPGTPVPSTPAVAASTPRPAIADAVQPEEPAAPLAIQPYDEVGTSKAIELRTMKPLYSIKRVLHRLPQEVSKDTVNAKRMLLGLHERLWHANATDLANLLLRAGMPPAVVEMAHEAVANCTICRKYSRLPARPKSKISLAAHFGDEVEMDIFYLWPKPFVLLIDVATRYKIAYETPSRETGELLKGLLHRWTSIFGPMRVLTSDQESAIMSSTAAIEFERLGVTRNPKGTTAGEAGRQHTGTGLVERHVALIKLTMQKVKAECDRQGLLVEDSDVATESSMSHNLCLTYGGYSPCMAVFGVVPRAFYEFETPQMTAITGAADRDATVFETALRLRQIALTAIQQSLAEDRLTRATLHRSHRVDTTELVPGTSTVEIYRDAAWRGPATLLEADQEEGTAIVKHKESPT